MNELIKEASYQGFYYNSISRISSSPEASGENK
jgi:hypothetical protein